MGRRSSRTRAIPPPSRRTNGACTTTAWCTFRSTTVEGYGNNASDHGLLVQNHEYTDDGLLFPDGNANWTPEKTLKSQNAHGVGVIEIKRDPPAAGEAARSRSGEWQVVRPSAYARRITGRTADEDGRAGRTVG